MIEHFRIAMINAGIEAPDILADGKLHRFNVDGDRAQTKNGWYILFDDGLPNGRFGCWKRGISDKWSGQEDQALTVGEKIFNSARMAAVKYLRDDERQRIQDECRNWCETTWQKAKAATIGHPYLQNKGILVHGLKTFKGSLIVPVHDTAKNIHGMQFIRPDGVKIFKTGTHKLGNFFKIGRGNDKVILICEGFATGASLHQATGQIVAVAFDAGNLKPVAETLRLIYPDHRFIICADNDQWGNTNTGIIQAHEAAHTVKGWIIIPTFQNTTSKPTDFNDLHQLEGLNEVRLQVEAATYA